MTEEQTKLMVIHNFISNVLSETSATSNLIAIERSDLEHILKISNVKPKPTRGEVMDKLRQNQKEFVNSLSEEEKAVLGSVDFTYLSA